MPTNPAQQPDVNFFELLKSYDSRLANLERGMQNQGTMLYGTAVLVAGVATVSSFPAVRSDSVIILTCQVPGGTPGFLRVSARSAGESFTITSSNGADTSTVGYILINPKR